MKNLINAVSGGVVIIVIATLIGLAHNAVRSNPVKVINSVKKPVAAITPLSTEPGVAAAESVAGELTAADVQQLVDEGITVILDARSVEEYTEGHIPGSINIPYDLLADYLDQLQQTTTPDQPVLCYCRGPECDLSDSLATELRLMGYENVAVFKAGWLAWEEAGYDVVTGSEPE